MKKFLKEFKEFITRGNIIDLAIGVIIGGAFSTIVNSLVNDIIMPLLHLATGDGVQGLSVVLNGVAKYLDDGTVNPEAVLWTYGNFLQAIINFIIIAICLFAALKVIMAIRHAGERAIEKQKKAIEKQLKKGAITKEEADKKAEELAATPAAEPAAAPAVDKTEQLLTEIRDLLKNQSLTSNVAADIQVETATKTK